MDVRSAGANTSALTRKASADIPSNGQVCQNEMATNGSSFGWDADTRTAPPWTRAGGGESVSSEYSLDFNVVLRWAGDGVVFYLDRNPRLEAGRVPAFGLDTPIAPPRTGADGDKTRLSKYCLYFKMILVLQLEGTGYWCRFRVH